MTEEINITLSSLEAEHLNHVLDVDLDCRRDNVQGEVITEELVQGWALIGLSLELQKKLKFQTKSRAHISQADATYLLEGLNHFFSLEGMNGKEGEECIKLLAKTYHEVRSLIMGERRSA